MSDNEHKLINIAPARNGGTPAPAKATLDLQEVQARLASAQGPRYWRSLEELSNAEGFSEMLEREFPNQAASWLDPVGRRGFMKLMGASLALAGLSACTKMPEEAIVPYVKQPEDLIPGKAKYYATAMPFGGAATPVMVESNMYRPTKVEGNPQHPMSMGAADTFAQASILGLYDPDRSQTLSYLGEVRTWGNFLGEMRAPMNAQKGMQGAGLRFLTETSSSPSLAAQIKALVKAYPQAKWYSYDPVNRDSARAGAKAAFGQYVDAHYQLEAADVVVSLDADFLSGAQFPGFLRYSRDFMARRKMDKGVKMNRLYVVESTPSTTGAKADHRLPLRASEIEAFARELANAITGATASSAAPGNGDARGKFIAAVARDLQKSRGASVIIPGEQQSAEVHALAHSMNQALGNAGKTVVYTDPVDVNPTEQTAALRELVDDINARKVNILVILGGNPVYNAPVDFNFEEAIRKVEVSVHLSLYQDETSRLSQWHIPEAHYLESWSDARAQDGSVSIIQPLIEPLYQGKTAHEVVAAFSDQPGANSYDLLQGYWKSQPGGGDFDGFWRRSLHDGFIASSALPVKNVSAKAATLPSGVSAASASSLELIFRPDPTIYDGRFNNNGWLQELPKPLTKLTWDNAVLISPALASAFKLENGDIVEVEAQGRKLKGAVFVLPGQPEKSITLHLGYGRSKTGRTGANTGFNAYALRTSSTPYFVGDANLTKTGDEYGLATTQSHNLIDNKSSLTGDEAEHRELIRIASLGEFEKNPDFAHEHAEEPSPDLSLYPKYDYTEHKWGMAIDLNSCVGCNACVVACQSENNIPVVGKDQVETGRAMHWIRIDTYFEGHDLANPATHFQPLPCMQCENAPCEPVCPVGATVHTTEGLNTMVYNRCVGTRYCANNCPYKVRHFNFLLYSDFETPSLKLMRNPEVTVRSRGVMEKCTYCLQRITAGRIAAEKENRWVRDGEVVTACQQTCPTNAIIFGNMNDPDSKVAKLKGDTRNYSLLADVNTRPRTTYIAGVRNPNPELEPAMAGKES